MSSRTFVGTVVAIGILIGVVASNYLPKWGSGSFGLGTESSQSGDGTGTQVSLDSPPAQPVQPSPVEKPAESVEPVAEIEEPPEATADVLLVLIDGRDYLVRESPGEKYRGVSLDEVVQLALATRGNDDSIRVRVSRRGSARFTAEEALRERLAEAGLIGESVRWEEGLVAD